MRARAEMRVKKKLLLIEPPFFRLYKETYGLEAYPLSLAYLASTVKRDTDWDVLVYNSDFCVNAECRQVAYLACEGYASYLKNLRDPDAKVWQEVRTVIREYQPSVVGITAKSQNFASARIVAKIVKELVTSAIVVVGGPHPSLVRKDALNYPEIDISVIGEGETTLIELLQRISTNRVFDDVEGICFRQNGQTVETPPRNLIENLDSLPYPHESAPDVLKDYNKYPASAFEGVFAIRGCPYHCSFCGSRYIWSRKVRFRSPENVAMEINALQRKGVKIIRFDDDTFGVTEDYIGKLCSALIKHCPGVKWSCEIHVKLVTEEVLSKMKSAGCYGISLGIESGDNGILRDIRKNITIEEAINACNLIKKKGIEVYVFFVVGFPNETEETLANTLKAIQNIDSDVVNYSIFTPYPGTDIFELCKRQGSVFDDFDVSLYNHQSPANHFCLNIPKARFRELASEIEKMVDQKTNSYRLKRLFSRRSFRKLWASSLTNAAIKGLSLLRDYVGR
jgi:tRNA A37 methylthiotransferase MiaB